jgi:hypothetical protein
MLRTRIVGDTARIDCRVIVGDTAQSKVPSTIQGASETMQLYFLEDEAQLTGLTANSTSKWGRIKMQFPVPALENYFFDGPGVASGDPKLA